MTRWMPHPLYALTTRPYVLAGAAPAWAEAGGYWLTLHGCHDLYLAPPPPQTKAKAKPKASAKPAASGEHWVTINGTHVLVDGSGVPVSASWEARLSRKPKREGGPPVGLEPETSKPQGGAAGQRAYEAQARAAEVSQAEVDALVAEAAGADPVGQDQAQAEAETAAALVEKAGLDKAAAQEQARWKHMVFDASSVLGDPNRHVNQVLVVDGHDAAGQPMAGVFKPPPSQDGASLESSLAYYGLDQLLGTGVVPPTVLRMVDAEQVPDLWADDKVQGTLQKFVPGFKPAEDYAPKKGLGYGHSDNEIVRYPAGRGKDGLNTFQRKVIRQHPENSERLQAALMLDTLMGNGDRHNENWGLDGDGRLWAVDNDAQDPAYSAKRVQDGFRTLNAPAILFDRDERLYNAPFVPLTSAQKTRWAKLSRADFDKLFAGVDYPGDYGGVDALWGNLQRILGEGGVGDPRGPVLDLAGAQ